MPSLPKGKPPTKSLKQILAQNGATVTFYRNMTLAAGASYNVIFFFFFYHHMCPLVMCMNILVTMIYITCYHLMRHISQPQYSMQTYQLVDLNKEGGLGEHLKDIMTVTSITQLMALFSNKFWFTFMVIPLRALWLIILGPWFTQQRVEDIEAQERPSQVVDKKKWRFL